MSTTIAADDKVGIEGAVFDSETGHAVCNLADVHCSTSSQTSCSAADSVSTFYRESLDVDVLQRQRSCSRNGLIVQSVENGRSAHSKQSGVVFSRPFQCCAISLDSN